MVFLIYAVFRASCHLWKEETRSNSCHLFEFPNLLMTLKASTNGPKKRLRAPKHGYGYYPHCLFAARTKQEQETCKYHVFPTSKRQKPYNWSCLCNLPSNNTVIHNVFSLLKSPRISCTHLYQKRCKTHIYIYSTAYVCMYACMHACMYVCMYVFTYVRTYVWMAGWMDVCMHVCMYVCKKKGRG